MSAFSAHSNNFVNTNDVTFSFIQYNEGNDYNATTGVFTCRIPGVYWFSATLLGSSDGVCYFLLNGSAKVYIGYPGGNYDTGTASQVLRLRHGDRVQVGHCYKPYTLPSDSLDSFSGVLVKAD